MTFLLLLIFVPIYLEHFDEINNAVKVIGGTAVVAVLCGLLYDQLSVLCSFQDSLIVILALVVAPSVVIIGGMRLVNKLFA